MKQIYLLFIAASLFAPLTTGCNQREPIASYEVAKPEGAEAEEPRAAEEILDHMLAAIVPQGDKAWFFKLVVPQATVEQRREDFLAFVQTVRLTEDDSQPITWEVPEGWEEQEGTGLRAATLLVPDGSAQAELTVMALPLTGDWDGYVVSNVNRWLGQLQQGPLDGQSIGQMVQTVSIAAPEGAEATWFELIGTMSRQAGRLPFGHPPIEGHPPMKVNPPSQDDTTDANDQ